MLFKKLQLLLHVRYSAHWLCLFLKYKEVYCSLISFVTLISDLFYNLNQSLRQCAELFRFDDKGRHQIHQLAERTHPDTFLDEAPLHPCHIHRTFGLYHADPATLSIALPSVQVSALNAILAVYSASYVLVLGAYFKLQTFLYLTGNGVVQGMRPLIGYNYGAGESKRVREIFRSALVLIARVMVIGTILCMAVPQTLIGLFTSNPETIQFGKEALRLISIGFIASSVSVTVSGALEGLGKGKESLVISVLRYIAVILPLAFILSKILGAAGVWHAFWITEVVVAGISYVICKKEIFQ